MPFLHLGKLRSEQIEQFLWLFVQKCVIKMAIYKIEAQIIHGAKGT